MEKLSVNKPTFVIKVHYKQNTTWQGTVQWVEKDRMRSFRSALELIRLMDEAVSEENNGNWDQEEF